MSARTRTGFTLIELMVALAAAGLLMASVVGLSASVQRSFGYAKDITELQGNLRFAMKTVVDDLARVSYMHAPNPGTDCHRDGPEPPAMPALAFDGSVLSLRGNFVSARDYLIDLNLGKVMCRNEMDLNAAVVSAEMSGECGGYEPYLAPFADGPDNLGDVFCPGQIVRMETSPGRFQYLPVTSVNPGTNGILLNLAAYSFNEKQGYLHFTNPLTLVQYQVAEDAGYTVPFSNPTAAAKRWVLTRQHDGCENGALTWANPIELAEFLLPQDPALPSGFSLEFVDDTNPANFPAPGQCPMNSAPAMFGPRTLLTAAGQLNPTRVRAFVITLRGRTVAEDPNYFLPNLSAAPAIWMNHGVDLDNSLSNGLAYVRSERTVIQLRNLSLNLTL